MGTPPPPLTPLVPPPPPLLLRENCCDAAAPDTEDRAAGPSPGAGLPRGCLLPTPRCAEAGSAAPPPPLLPNRRAAEPSGAPPPPPPAEPRGDCIVRWPSLRLKGFGLYQPGSVDGDTYMSLPPSPVSSNVPEIVQIRNITPAKAQRNKPSPCCSPARVSLLVERLHHRGPMLLLVHHLEPGLRVGLCGGRGRRGGGRDRH